MKASEREERLGLALRLPHIRPARSLPAIRPAKEFDLRCVNLPMKPYNPSNDKFLSQFFERQTRIRALSTEPHQKSIKTEAAVEYKDGHTLKERQRKQKRLVTEASRTEAVKEVSRVDFNNFLESMRQRASKHK